MFCSECGSKNEEGAVFCEKCGNRLDSEVKTIKQGNQDMLQVAHHASSAAIVTQPSAPIDSSSASYDPTISLTASGVADNGHGTIIDTTGAAPKSNKSSKKVPVIVAIVFILILVGAGCLLVFSGILDFGSVENQGSAEDSAQNAPVEQSAQATAEAEKSNHVVIFETDGGTSYEELQVRADDSIKSPSVPKRYGYAFDGWFLDSSCTQPVVFPYTVKQDDPEKIVFYAKWVDLNESQRLNSSNLSSYDETDYDDGLFPQSSTEYLDEYDLAGLSKDEIQRAINEIYARNGYIFQKSQTEKRYFESQPWYEGTEKDMGKVRSKFNKYELANEKLLTEYRSYMD